METKRCKFRLFLALLVSFIVFFSGCEQDGAEIDEGSFYTKMYKDSTFLKIEGDLNDPLIIWGSVDTYLEAYSRMKCHLKLKENQLVWGFKNASELKISENIFNYVIYAWTYKNKQLASEEYKLLYTETGFIVVPKIQKELTRATGGYVLKGGSDDGTMRFLHNMCENMRNDCLCNYVDIERTNFSSGGYGSIIGRGTSNLGSWSYYCCNACSSSGQVDCRKNWMVSNNSYEQGSIFYEKILNEDNLPLITVQNYRYFR